MRENRETPSPPASSVAWAGGRTRWSDKALMHGGGESYSGVVPTKQPNKSGRPPAEVAEGRAADQGETRQPKPYRTPSRESGPKRAGACARSSEAGWEAAAPIPNSGVDANIRGKNRVR